MACAWPSSEATAAVAQLTSSDVVLAVYASDGSNWRQLTSGALAGVFGPHRCACPATLSPIVELTDAGKTALANSTSTITVNFLLGKSCTAASASCVSLGQVAFTATQSVDSPQFDSSLVYQTAAGSSGVTCGALKAGSATVSAVLSQDGVALPFALSMDLPITTATVPAPTAVAALPSDKGILVSWTPPADDSLVAGYQVLCLPRPATPSTAGYETCGLGTTAAGGAILTPADTTEVCSAVVSATEHQVRLNGLTNGTPYTVAVVSIDPSGGTSPLSPSAPATPAPTSGFYDNYKHAGGAASGCALAPEPASSRGRWIWIVVTMAIIVAIIAARIWRRRRGRDIAAITSAVVLVLAFSTAARAQIRPERGTDDWAMNSDAHGNDMPPEWGLEVGISRYRPAVDSEFGAGVHPYADTFGSSSHWMSEVEVDRYFGHGIGSWGVGMRICYTKLTGTANLPDGTRSGDETGLRLVPLSLSALYKADGLPGLGRVPLIPYVKGGLDGVVWTESTSGGKPSHSGFTPGWHVAGGLALGLNSLGTGPVKPGAIAGSGSIFFEWDYAAINGLGLGSALHVGDSTWFAGLMFDL